MVEVTGSFPENPEEGSLTQSGEESQRRWPGGQGSLYLSLGVSGEMVRNKGERQLGQLTQDYGCLHPFFACVCGYTYTPMCATWHVSQLGAFTILSEIHIQWSSDTSPTRLLWPPQVWQRGGRKGLHPEVLVVSPGGGSLTNVGSQRAWWARVC